MINKLKLIACGGCLLIQANSVIAMNDVVNAFKSAVAEVGENVVMGAVEGACIGGTPAIAGGIAFGAVKSVLNEMKEFQGILNRPGAKEAVKAVMKDYGIDVE